MLHAWMFDVEETIQQSDCIYEYAICEMSVVIEHLTKLSLEKFFVISKTSGVIKKTPHKVAVEAFLHSIYMSFLCNYVHEFWHLKKYVTHLGV